MSAETESFAERLTRAIDEWETDRHAAWQLLRSDCRTLAMMSGDLICIRLGGIPACRPVYYNQTDWYTGTSLESRLTPPNRL